MLFKLDMKRLIWNIWERTRLYINNHWVIFTYGNLSIHPGTEPVILGTWLWLIPYWKARTQFSTFVSLDRDWKCSIVSLKVRMEESSLIGTKINFSKPIVIELCIVILVQMLIEKKLSQTKVTYLAKKRSIFWLCKISLHDRGLELNRLVNVESLAMG